MRWLLAFCLNFCPGLTVVPWCRTTRKAEKGREEKRKQLGLSEAVKLLPESDGDAQAASMVAFGSSSSYLNNRCDSLPSTCAHASLGGAVNPC